jgi:hypothetical protein
MKGFPRLLECFQVQCIVTGLREEMTNMCVEHFDDILAIIIDNTLQGADEPAI